MSVVSATGRSTGWYEREEWSWGTGENSDLSQEVRDRLSEEVIFKLSPEPLRMNRSEKCVRKEGLRKRTASAKAWRQEKSLACSRTKRRPLWLEYHDQRERVALAETGDTGRAGEAAV